MRNLLLGDQSFESGLDNWYYAQTDKRPIRREGDAADGRYSMELCGESVFSRWFYHLIQPQTDYVLSFYAKAEEVGSTVSVSCMDGWDGLGGGCFELSNEWERYSFPLLRQTFPRNLWMILDSTGKALIDAFQLEEGTSPSAYESPQEIGIYVTTGSPSEVYVREKDGPLKVTVSICCFEHKGPLEAQIEVKRFGEKQIYCERGELNFDGTGRTSFDIMLPEAEISGYYPVFVRIYDEGGNLLCESEEPFVAVNALPEDIDRDFFGIHSSRVTVEAMKRIGVGWVRFGAPDWNSLEPEQGKMKSFFSPNWHEKGIKRLTAIHGLASPPQWATTEHTLPCKGEEVEAMTQYVVDELGTDTDFYEMDNEPDLTMANFHNVSKEVAAHAFATMACSIGKVIHKNGGKLSYNVSGGGSDAMLFAEIAMREATEAFDGFAPHLYSWPRYVGEGKEFVSTPEEANLRAQIQNSQDLIERNGGNKELFIGEYGYALDYEAPCDSLHAGLHGAYIARSYLLAMSVPEMKRIFYFTDYYTVEDRYDYGLWRANCRPTLAVSAFATCAELTAGSTCIPHILGPDFYVLEYVRDKKSVFAVWNCNLKAERELRQIELKTERVTGVTMTGTPIAKEEGLRAKIGPYPTYLIVNRKESRALLEEIQQELIRIQPYTIEVVRTTRQSLTLIIQPVQGLRESYKDTLDIHVAGEQLEEEVVVIPGKETVVKIQIEKQLNLKSLAVRINAKRNGNEFQKQLPPLLVCKYLRGIDWQKYDFLKEKDLIVLDQRTDVAPPDPGIGWAGPEDLSARIFCGWDDLNLYLMVNVQDDIHCQPHADELIWQGDCVQFGLDLGNDAKYGGYDLLNDYEFGVALSEMGPMVWCWAAPTGKEKGKTDFPAKVERTDGVTEYRVALPWAHLLGEAPKSGTVIGIGIVIPDNDGSGVRFHLQTDSGVVGTKRPYLFSKMVLDS